MVYHVRRVALRVLTPAALIGASSHASAHAIAVHDELHGSAEPWVVLLLALSVALYAIGIARLWHHAGPGAGITRARAAAFLTGWIVLVVALCSPIDTVAAELFSVHMVQHELLMVAAAPLLVLGRPLATWAWALPASSRASVGRWTRDPVVRVPWRIITHPLGAFGIHAAALWLWHVPSLFAAALANDAIHAAQHASFLGSALLFWWAVLQPAHTRLRDGVAVLYLFGTMLHTGALGALLTVSTAPWYPLATTAAWGLSALEDQQIGGLIMWIPAGTVYIAAALWLMARWMSGSPATSAKMGYADVT